MAAAGCHIGTLGWLKVEPPTHCRAVLFHVELEPVESVAVFVIKVEIPVTNINAGPIVEPIGKRAGEDGDQISTHAKTARPVPQVKTFSEVRIGSISIKCSEYVVAIRLYGGFAPV